MAGVITGKARSTTGCRLKITDPIVMPMARGKAGNSGDCRPDPGDVIDERQARRNVRLLEEQKRKDAKLAKRRAAWERRKNARKG